jgi:hypothetical protein
LIGNKNKKFSLSWSVSHEGNQFFKCEPLARNSHSKLICGEKGITFGDPFLIILSKHRNQFFLAEIILFFSLASIRSELRLIPTKKPISQRLIGFLFAESGGQFSNSLFEDLKVLDEVLREMKREI